jgi:hypothetical protein
LRAAGIQTELGCHSFRATGITVYLQNGGLLDHAQQMAAHESARTTKLYDRRNDQVTLCCNLDYLYGWRCNIPQLPDIHNEETRHSGRLFPYLWSRKSFFDLIHALTQCKFKAAALRC